MRTLTPLPEPSHAALEHSQALKRLIQAEIAAAGGWISFERYMRLALYAPGMGYYSAGAEKFGQAGDFVTAPEISSLFGRTLARQAAQVLGLINEEADILEFGAGTANLTLDLLLELERLGNLPAHYFILEVSAELRQRQRRMLEEHAAHLLPRVLWLERLPAEFNGLILANEVLDAMPVHLVAWRDDNLFERGIICDDNEFQWRERPLEEGELFAAARELNPLIEERSEGAGYISEINLSAQYFIHGLADILQKGAILLIDYGFGRREYYHPQRSRGTLMCHYRHFAHDDPFYLPGLQDITAHVDFSAIADMAAKDGLTLLGYNTQAHFLINCGITGILARIPAENTGEYLPLANQLQKLVSPAEMGELFKAIAFGRNISGPLAGFASGDKSRLL
jgi:SAM-dependent MidA family methyltransferase